jgi:hypothetical protein
MPAEHGVNDVSEVLAASIIRAMIHRPDDGDSFFETSITLCQTATSQKTVIFFPTLISLLN